jgi:hypothetical protein
MLRRTYFSVRLEAWHTSIAFYFYILFLTHPQPLSTGREGSIEVPSLLVEKGYRDESKIRN